jgi:hypothetical protein
MKRVLTWRDDFIGQRVYSPTAGSNVGHNWIITDTSAAGTPTYAPVTADRGVKIDFDSQNEVQNVCLSHNDKLMFRLTDILEFRFRAKMNQAAVNAATTWTAGLTSARNDNADSPTVNAQFKIDGSASTTLVVVETDDNVNDNDDKATGKTLINAEKEFVISFANGLRDVRFFIDGEPVAVGGGASANDGRFDMSNVSATQAVQPNFQQSKTASANTDGFTIRSVEIVYRDGTP